MADSHPPPDALHQLVDGCLAGDSAAARRFVENYSGRIFGLCWRMLAHRQDAEDATQETFVRALRNLSQWDRNRPLEPWLLAIAGNRCRSMLARCAKRPTALPLLETDLPCDHRPHESVRQLAEEMQRALDRIRVEYAQAFRLLHEQQLSYAEIAAALNCPLGTVKTFVYRARREIINELSKRGVLPPVRPSVPADAAST